MNIRLFLNKLLPHNLLWGSSTKKRCFLLAITFVVFDIFMWRHYNGLVGNIDVNQIKTDAIEERLEEQIRGFDGVDAAEVKMDEDGSVLIKLKVQPGFRSEEQIREYIQAFVSCTPENILLDIEKNEPL